MLRTITYDQCVVEAKLRTENIGATREEIKWILGPMAFWFFLFTQIDGITQGKNKNRP